MLLSYLFLFPSHDRVQISDGNDGIPICKVVDCGKYKYDLSKKKKEIAKKQRESSVKIKEIKLRPSTDTNDLNTKASKAKEILSEGDKIKISVVFRGREMAHREVGHDTLKSFVGLIPNILLNGDPVFQGRVLSVIGSLSTGKDTDKDTPDDSNK